MSPGHLYATLIVSASTSGPELTTLNYERYASTQAVIIQSLSPTSRTDQDAISRSPLSGACGTVCMLHGERIATAGEKRTPRACKQTAGRSQQICTSDLCVRWRRTYTRSTDTDALLCRFLFFSRFLVDSAYLRRTRNSLVVETPDIVAAAGRRPTSSKMNRVGQQHVTRVWTGVDAPATAFQWHSERVWKAK